MTTGLIEKTETKPFVIRKYIELLVIFMLIAIVIVMIRGFSKKESEFTDSIADQIEQEMKENHIILNSNGGRRTVVEFKEPIIATHGKASSLIVHTANLSETISIANEGLWGLAWTSSYQDIVFEGNAQYTVDLSKLSDDDFVINNEMKTLTVRIPYAVLSQINIPDDQIKFMDVKRGFVAPKDIKMTPEDNARLRSQVNEKMKAKLIDENIIALANENAKTVVADLLGATVSAIDPEFAVVVVQ